MNAPPALGVRPLSPGEILDESLRLVRLHFRPLLQLVLGTYLPWTILLQLAIVPWYRRAAEDFAWYATDEVLQMTAVVAGLMFLDYAVLRQFARGAIFAALGQYYQGHAISRRRAVRQSLRRLPATIVATLLCGGLLGASQLLQVAIALADPALALTLSLIFIPLFFLGVACVIGTWLVVPVIQLENRGVISGTIRGIRLTMEGIVPILTTVLVLTIVSVGMTVLAGLISNLWLQTALATVISALLLLPETVTEVVLLLSIRARSENFDLELLAREVALVDAEDAEVRGAGQGLRNVVTR